MATRWRVLAFWWSALATISHAYRFHDTLWSANPKDEIIESKSHKIVAEGAADTSQNKLTRLVDQIKIPFADAEEPVDPTKFYRLCKVLFPLSGILLIIAGIMFIRKLKIRGDDHPAIRRATRRSSYGIKDAHPLLTQQSFVQAQLHQHRHLNEQLERTFNKRRLGTLSLGLGISLLAATCLPDEMFAVTRRIHAVEKSSCQRWCRERKGALCEGDNLEFYIGYCTRKGKCERKRPAANRTDVNPKLYHRRAKCVFKVVPAAWKIDFVLICLVFSISLIVEGVSSELILVGVSCLFACFGIISAKQAFSGFGNSGVVGLAMLFPVAAAIEETGVLDAVVSKLLGQSSNVNVALFRMMIPVAILSAFLSNTAIVTMMIPIIVSWAKRSGISPGKLLMPLSYASQLGGTTTLIGSSICLVAKNSVKGYNLGFFDLAIPGFTICFIMLGFIVLCLPMLSSSHDEPEPEQEQRKISKESPGISLQVPKNYEVALVVGSGCSFCGASMSEVSNQLCRQPGVEGVTSDAEVVSADSILRCRCTARGVVALRQMKGLLLSNDGSLKKLGAYRRERSLYEAAVRPESLIVGRSLDIDAMRQVLGCCPVAIRGKASLNGVIEGGDVLLLEAEERFVQEATWVQEFLLTTKIPNSSPPRIGGPRDALRGALVCLGMVVLIGLVSGNVVGLAPGAGVFLLVLVLIRARSISQVYQSMNASVLLTIAGAFGFSEALQATGVAGFASDGITQIAKPAGKLGLRAALYLFSMFFSMFMNNSATVAIIGPLLDKVAVETKQSLAGLLFTVVFGAGACFMTPLGYQTNMMVMSDGGYTFGDFVKFGAPIQALHCATSMFAVWLCIDVLELH